MASVTALVRTWLPHAIATFNSVIFLDSLRYKFTNHPNTQEIFGRLNDWSTSLGAPGLFAQTGLFSQYVIGTGELIASSCFLIGMLVKPYRWLQAIAAIVGLAIMTGAISFHLFTPLGTDPNNDGGGLFMAACTVWVGCVAMIFLRFHEVKILGGKLAVFARPAS